MTTSMGALPLNLQERLCLAAHDDPVETIWVLVKEGVDVVRCDAEGLTALHYAASYNGNVKTVRVILELGGDARARSVVTNVQTQPSRVLVMSRGNALAYGAKMGGTLVHWAALGGHVETVKLLVKMRGDAHIQDALGNQALKLPFKMASD
jgi:ankyrin repeat protein